MVMFVCQPCGRSRTPAITEVIQCRLAMLPSPSTLLARAKSHLTLRKCARKIDTTKLDLFQSTDDSKPQFVVYTQAEERKKAAMVVVTTVGVRASEEDMRKKDGEKGGVGEVKRHSGKPRSWKEELAVSVHEHVIVEEEGC